VSHVWSAPFIDVIDSLAYQLQLAPQDERSSRTYLWIDIFAVNQVIFPSSELLLRTPLFSLLIPLKHSNFEQADDLRNLEIALQKSSQTLVCLDCSNRLLGRIWCLFEIWSTFKLEGAEKRLRIIAKNVNFNQLKTTFIQFDVAKAEATVLSDRERILQVRTSLRHYSLL
jgi:hypothetical protein